MMLTPQEFKEKYSQETYLGDGLYVHFDGYQFILRAPRELGDHYVALEPSVFDNFLLYRGKVYEDAGNIQYEKDKNNL